MKQYAFCVSTATFLLERSNRCMERWLRLGLPSTCTSAEVEEGKGDEEGAPVPPPRADEGEKIDDEEEDALEEEEAKAAA